MKIEFVFKGYEADVLSELLEVLLPIIKLLGFNVETAAVVPDEITPEESEG